MLSCVLLACASQAAATQSSTSPKLAARLPPQTSRNAACSAASAQTMPPIPTRTIARATAPASPTSAASRRRCRRGHLLQAASEGVKLRVHARAVGLHRLDRSPQSAPQGQRAAGQWAVQVIGSLAVLLQHTVSYSRLSETRHQVGKPVERRHLPMRQNVHVAHASLQVGHELRAIAEVGRGPRVAFSELLL